MPKVKQFAKEIMVRVSVEMAARIKAVLRDGEARPDLIRAAIERELQRREKN